MTVPAAALPAPPVDGATVFVGEAWVGEVCVGEAVPVAELVTLDGHCGCPSAYSVHTGAGLEDEVCTGAIGTVDDGTTYVEGATLVETGHCGCPSTYSVHTAVGLAEEDTGATDGHCGCPSTYSVHTGATETVDVGTTDEVLVAVQKLSYHVQYALSSAGLQVLWMHLSTLVLPQRSDSDEMPAFTKHLLQQSGVDVGAAGAVDDGVTDGHCGCPSTYSVHTGAGDDQVVGAVQTELEDVLVTARGEQLLVVVV